MRRATLHLDRIEPGLAELVLADPDLSLPAKLTLLYVLGHAEQPHHRHELAAVDTLVGDHLDEVLHELVGRHWLATVPPDAPPCRAARFQLRQDHDPDEDDAAQVDGALRLTHLAAGLTWAVGGVGSDGRG